MECRAATSSGRRASRMVSRKFGFHDNRPVGQSGTALSCADTPDKALSMWVSAAWMNFIEGVLHG